ncbi:MAG: nucleotidyltransferase family protein [Alphaproteobacteria bacterium]|nr:nucleotidyltransferase family protein [Alphaproteobacteria bacterium]
MSAPPRRAMVLAAGRGSRMRPLTDLTPKPLLELDGRSLLDHALDRLAKVGVEQAVVNTHWQADRIAASLAARPEPPSVVIRREATLLDTGGGVHAALPLLGEEPFFVVNGDAYWLDGPRPALARLAAALDPAASDAVLLLQRSCYVQADVGFGDFALDQLGAPRRRTSREIVPYVYAGLQIVTTAFLRGAPDGPFSMNLLWDRALAAGRLRAIVHDGLWFHLSTPADLAQAEIALQLRAREAPR